MAFKMAHLTGLTFAFSSLNLLFKLKYSRKRDSVSAVIHLRKACFLPLTGRPYPRSLVGVLPFPHSRLFGLHASGVYPCTCRSPGNIVSVALYDYSQLKFEFLSPSSGHPAPACARHRTTSSCINQDVRVSTFLCLIFRTYYNSFHCQWHVLIPYNKQQLPAVL